MTKRSTFRTATGLLIVAACLAGWVLLRDRLADAGPAASPAPAGSPADALDGLLAAFPDHGFAPLAGDWRLSLPADHGGHDDARMETWILSAHLEDDEGRATGVHFALSRFGIRRGDPADGAAGWALGALHRGQLALVRGGDGASTTEARFSRGAAGSAGHDDARGEVWLDDWSLSFDPAENDGALTLKARIGGERLRLVLTPLKPALAAPGGDGAPLRGFAIPRLAARGVLGDGARRRDLTGTAWLDRAWGELPLPGRGPVTRDRLLLQLDDGTDLSLLRTRRRDGRGAATLDGVIVDEAGGAREVDGAGLRMAPARTPTTVGGAAFALDWTVSGPGLELSVTPVAVDQDLAFGEPVWNGLVRVEGRRDGSPVTGLGALQASATVAP